MLNNIKFKVNKNQHLIKSKPVEFDDGTFDEEDIEYYIIVNDKEIYVYEHKEMWVIDEYLEDIDDCDLLIKYIENNFELIDYNLDNEYLDSEWQDYLDNLSDENFNNFLWKHFESYMLDMLYGNDSISNMEKFNIIRNESTKK